MFCVIISSLYFITILLLRNKTWLFDQIKVLTAFYHLEMRGDFFISRKLAVWLCIFEYVCILFLYIQRCQTRRHISVLFAWSDKTVTKCLNLNCFYCATLQWAIASLHKKSVFFSFFSAKQVDRCSQEWLSGCKLNAKDKQGLGVANTFLHTASFPDSYFRNISYFVTPIAV